MKAKIIPAIDLMNGEVVRLYRGDRKHPTFYPHSPLEVAKNFEEMGIKRIHIIDLEGAMEGKAVHRDLIIKIRESVDCSLQVGGGIRDYQTAEEYLTSGIDYILISSMAYTKRMEFEKLVETYPERIILTVDVKEGKPVIHGWEKSLEIDLKSYMEKFRHLPLSSVLFTSVERDGTLEGPDIEGLKEFLQLSPFPVICAGGISSEKDINSLLKLNSEKLEGIIVGKAYYEKKVDLKKFFL